MSARRHFLRTSDEGASASFARMCRIRLLASKFVQYFLKRTLCLICYISTLCELDSTCPWAMSIKLIAIYCDFFKIFIIEIGEMAFFKPEIIIIKSNYFQSAQKGKCFLGDFEALVREIVVRALVLQNHSL
jgi:hypothetical protein